MPASTFVCNKSSLSRSEQRRHAKLREQLSAAIVERRELPDGYAYRLPAGHGYAVKAKQFMEFERRCCPFLRMWMAPASDRVGLWVHVTGEAGAKQFIEAGMRSHPDAAIAGRAGVRS